MYSQSLAKHLPLLFISFLLLLSPLPTLALDTRNSPTPESCLDYETTANRSIIGANSTYRAAFLQKSGTGTMYNARMFDAASKRLPALTADKALNRGCGNWTEIALKGAEANYSVGVVAQFSTEGLPVGIKAGPELVGIIGAIAVIMSFVWVFS